MDDKTKELSNKETVISFPNILKRHGFSLNEHIFRYRRDDILGSANTLNEILKNEMWHSSVALLNDPFELFFKGNDNEMNEISDHDLLFLWKKLNKITQSNKNSEIFFYLNKDKIKSEISGALKTPVNDLINDVREMVCMACFTQVCDSRLMWGYYCNGLSGICLIYNKNKLSKNGIPLVKIIYSDERPRINLCQHVINFNRGGSVEFMIDIVRNKHKEWVHEQEYRSINTLNTKQERQAGGKIENINERCVDGIIIGENCNEKTIDILITYAKKFEVKLFLAKANLEKYIVEIAKM